MQAEVELLAGEYTGSELCVHLAHTLTHAAWTDNVHMPIAKGSNRYADVCCRMLTYADVC